MNSERKQTLLDTLVNRACALIDRRNEKNGLTGKAKDAARDKQRVAECDLADAVERYRKER